MFIRKLTALLLSALLIVAPVAPLLMLGSCKAEQIATPAEQATLDTQDADMDQAEAEMAAAEAAAGESIKTAGSLGKEFAEAAAAVAEAATSGDPAAAMEAVARLEQVKGDLEGVRAEFEGSLATWQGASDTWDATAAEQQELLDELAARRTETAQGLAGAIDPRLGLLVGLAGPLVARFGFSRSREHLGVFVKKALKGAFGEAAGSLGKAYGVGHTSYDPVQLLGAAEQMAREKGDDVTVAEIKALREKLAA